MPIGNLPRVGAMLELVTYKCPACGHVETLENLSSQLRAQVGAASGAALPVVSPAALMK